MRKVGLVVFVILVVALSSCKQERDVILVTTTSVENSGLLEYLLPTFEEQYNINVQVVAVGTGAAIELAKLGQADVLLVHDYEIELAFMEAGYGEKRSDLMYNHFVYVGPKQVDHDGTLESFLNTIYQNYTFLSRGDDSGTYVKEQALWNLLSVPISFNEDWYYESGQGMGPTLVMASLKGYYTLTDQGTYFSMRSNLDLDIVYSDDDLLLNPYGIIKISENLHNRDKEPAELLYQWFLTEETLDSIRQFTVDNEVLFYPYD